MPVVALQDKSPRLARLLARGLNSRLSPVARPSCQTTRLGKTDSSHSFLTLLYIDPYTHEIQRASERILSEKPQRKTRLIHPQSSHRDSSNSSTLFLSIVKSLRGTLSKPFLTIPISIKRLFGVWEAVKKGPISYWLMLWSSNEIQ